LLTEDDLEQTVLSCLNGLGCKVLFSPDIAPDELLDERVDFSEVVLKTRLAGAVARLHPSLDAMDIL